MESLRRRSLRVIKYMNKGLALIELLVVIARKLLDFLLNLCYNYDMYNWSIDEKQLDKSPRKKAIWRMQQMVNFGLNGEKISEKELRQFWDSLQIDESRRKFLSMLINAH